MEAKTMIEMFNKTIFYNLESLILSLKTTGLSKDLLLNITSSRNFLFNEISNLSSLMENIKSETTSSLVRDKILPTMKIIRKEYDKIEPLIPDNFMAFPNYNKILY